MKPAWYNPWQNMKNKNLITQAFVLFFLVIFLCGSSFAQSDCAESARVDEPALSAEAKAKFEKELADAITKLGNLRAKGAVIRETVGTKTYSDAEVWVGRRYGYLGEYRQAIYEFSEGIKNHPNDARFYRHRGHRYITLRCFDDAISDFETAAKLIKGKPDEIEPDGLPNARNIPTSTLQSNIWYHLGLAYYLKADFNNALRAYKECLKVSRNPDMLVATTNWLYITFRRLGRIDEANQSIAPIKDDLDLIENDGYYKLIKVYQGKIAADDLLKEIGNNGDSLSDASIGYGLGNWYLINGESDKATKVFTNITAGDQWSSFGFIAAEAKLKR